MQFPLKFQHLKDGKLYAIEGKPYVKLKLTKNQVLLKFDPVYQLNSNDLVNLNKIFVENTRYAQLEEDKVKWDEICLKIFIVCFVIYCIIVILYSLAQMNGF